MCQTFLAVFPRVELVAIATSIGTNSVSVAWLGSTSKIVLVASIANGLNFLFRRCFLFSVSVLFCFTLILLGIILTKMIFTILEEIFHSFGCRGVILRGWDVMFVVNGFVIVQLWAYCRYHHFVSILKLCLILTLGAREVLVRPVGLQVYTLTVRKYHVLNLQLNYLAIVFAVVEVVGGDNLRFLYKNIIEALFTKGAPAERNGGVT